MITYIFLVLDSSDLCLTLINMFTFSLNLHIPIALFVLLLWFDRSCQSSVATMTVWRIAGRSHLRAICALLLSLTVLVG